MATLSDFLPHVLPYVPGCSRPLAELHIRNVLMDFCTWAPVVQQTLDPLTVVQDVRDYDFETDVGTVVTHVLEVKYRGRDIDIYKAGDPRIDRTGQRVEPPSGIILNANNAFSLNATPDTTVIGALQLLVATKPGPRAQQVADLLLNDYGYEIGQGAVARLMKVPGQTFSAPGAAYAYEAPYLKARTDARIRAEASFGGAQTRVRSRRFGT